MERTFRWVEGSEFVVIESAGGVGRAGGVSTARLLPVLQERRGLLRHRQLVCALKRLLTHNVRKSRRALQMRLLGTMARP